jgi:hypothetical protein
MLGEGRARAPVRASPSMISYIATQLSNFFNTMYRQLAHFLVKLHVLHVSDYPVNNYKNLNFINKSRQKL